MPAGGARPGAGRRTLAEHLKTSDLARKALVEKYGSLEEALIAVLKMDEPVLTRFVLEHAFGKPKESIALDGNSKLEVIVRYGRKGNNNADTTPPEPGEGTTGGEEV